uniref:Sortilin-related receptor n=1 Tax=Rhodnius prolixus TaxID=13249 RepID=T1H8D0_RHOPR
MTVDKWYLLWMNFFYIILMTNFVSGYDVISVEKEQNNDIFTFELSEPINSLDDLKIVKHYLHKRNTPQQTNITTAVTSLNTFQQQLLVHWAGQGSNVLICLARNSLPAVDSQPSPSAVYISYDYGNTFINKTDSFKLDNKTYASVDKFFTYYKERKFIVFMDKTNGTLFVTKDFGKVFTKIKLKFQPANILFYPENPLVFLVYSIDKTIWITRDFGQSFSVAQEMVKSYFWAERWYDPWADEPFRSLLVQRIEPSLSTAIALIDIYTTDKPRLKVLISNIEQFTNNGDFLFASRRISPTHNELYISYQGGKFFKAIFDSELECAGFHVADATDKRLLVAVAHTATLSNLYVSEVTSSDKYLFRLSLERLFCYLPGTTWKESWLSDVADGAFADIHKVKGMHGIFLASQVTSTAKSANLNPEHLTTVITFDWGGEWKPLIPPKVDERGQSLNCNISNGCGLHLSQKFSYLFPVTRSPPILTTSSAPGLIIAAGTIGTSLKGHAGIFISRDAGLSWIKILRENYLFNIGDHGGIITAVKGFKTAGETNEIHYSLDEGETWNAHVFVEENIRVYGLMTEPGENTTVFTLFGSKPTQHKWLIVNIDLRNAFSLNCTKDDYKMWSPSSSTNMKMACVMGRKETYERRIRHTKCFNGRDYDRPVGVETCMCDLEDYECDFGFIRHVSSAECIRNRSITHDPYKIPTPCEPGKFYNRTKGYRKIDGDVCVGGFERNYLPDVLPCPYDEKRQFLLLAQKERIVRFDIANPVSEVLPVKDLKNLIAIDFDMKNNCVYFADILTDKIGRQCLQSGTDDIEYLVESELDSVEGVALDWISNLLYFVDGGNAKIEVVRTDIHNSGRMRRTILNNTVLIKPRGIALHPVKGYMYWTDWSTENPSVSRASLDGSKIKQLFTKPTVVWPNGITVDHISEHIYWVDAKLDYIATADLEGRNFRKVISNEARVAHPFSVAVYKDNLYWDDWNQNSIFVADKDLGIGIQPIALLFPGLMDLKVYAHGIQEGTNACNKSHTCSHLCFAQPNNEKPVCACPDGMILQEGKCLCPDGSIPSQNNTCAKKATTCAANMFSCSNNNCIPNLWKCDGEDDCGDNSEEINCEEKSCAPGTFQCKDGKCIPPSWYCDHEQDCDDGSDEFNCTVKECAPNKFQCDNKHCISKRWVCDTEDDCKDGSDEKNCPTVTPQINNCDEFACKNSHYNCIPRLWVCDGEVDCADHSDEERCEQTTCEPWQFQCKKSNRCIFDSWRCDGDDDCGDSDESDEENCNHSLVPDVTPSFKNCLNWMFECTNKLCIPSWWKCDTIDDCGDGSDELGCDESGTTVAPSSATQHPTVCSANKFRCENGACIQQSWVCDGLPDCSHGEDEKHCDASVCNDTDEFRCKKSGWCVPMKQYCDGIKQCPDGTDEMFCDNVASTTAAASKPADPSCRPGFFSCDGSRCHPLSRLCDAHQDCYDGTDESNCTNSINRIYQVVHMVVDEHEKNSTSLPLRWWIQTPPGIKLEFLPSISEVPKLNKLAKWMNSTKWTTENKYTYTNLLPFTKYNLTVLVRLNGSENEFPPAFFLTATTSEDLPSPPWNLSVLQKNGTQVFLKWQAPRKPNGIITHYTVFTSPPVPPAEYIVPSTKVETTISEFFTSGVMYKFWITAVNDAGQSNISNVVSIVSDSEANVGNIHNLVVEDVHETSVSLKWDPTPNAEGYLVQPLTSPPYAKLPAITTTASHYIYKNLAPGAQYTFRVNAYNKEYHGAEFYITVETPGRELPVVPGLTVQVSKQLGTSAKLHWESPKDTRKEKWNYGIYFSKIPKALFDAVKIDTTNTSVTVHNLEACESYLFDVSVLGPLGQGPLSASPVSVVTEYNAKAPPKNLGLAPVPGNDSLMEITWSSSCPVIRDKVGYMISVRELSLGRNYSITLLPTNETNLSHQIYVYYGAKYRVSVQTDVDNSVPSEEVEVWAPALPSPHQLVVELQPQNSSFIIYWSLQVEGIAKMPKHYYEVLVSEGPDFDESKVEIYKANESPYVLHNKKDGVMYSFAVRAVSDKGFKSPLSEITSMPIEHWAAQAITSTTYASIFVSALVIALLLALLTVLIVRHRRLQNTFSSFANSHYSTRSGAATFTSDGLDDEDSPVIRGFSDDEPLVVA